MGFYYPRCGVSTSPQNWKKFFCPHRFVRRFYNYQKSRKQKIINILQFQKNKMSWMIISLFLFSIILQTLSLITLRGAHFQNSQHVYVPLLKISSSSFSPSVLLTLSPLPLILFLPFLSISIISIALAYVFSFSFHPLLFTLDFSWVPSYSIHFSRLFIYCCVSTVGNPDWSITNC